MADNSGSNARSEAGDEYIVKSILHKRIVTGKVEYLLQWEWSEDITWESEGNLGCPDLIAEFERQWGEVKERKKEKKKKEPSGEGGFAKVSGFERGLIPEEIIGSTISSGELMYMMKWKNSDEADLVLAREASVKCPLVVVAFYESHRRTSSFNNNSDKLIF